MLKKLSQPKTQNFDLCICPSKNVVKRDASGRKVSCHVVDAFLTRLKLIYIANVQPENLQNA